MQPRQKRFRLSRLLATLFVVALFTVGFWQRYNILDWWQLRDYQPSATVTALATRTDMTNKARRIFYVNQPAIQDKTDFYESCAGGETSVVLGCYKPRNGIYILRVDDERLKGIQEVTAAHEMLHAAYGRLDGRQQKRIADLLDSAYRNLGDQAIKDKIKLYQDSGADITNELHSILGTEVSSLPAELETYYQQYFIKRSTVVAFAAQYQAEFTNRKNKVAEYDAQLASLEEQVNTNNQSLQELKASINAESARLDALLKENMIEEYNAGVQTYNQSLLPFRQLLAQTQNIVDQYKTILDERNKIASEAQELGRALDSTKVDTKVQDIQ